MPVLLRHNDELELSLVEYQGPVSVAELKALAAFNARNPALMAQDALNLILPGAHFTASMADLDALFDYYRSLFEPLRLEIMRRAAWVCLSPRAQPHLDHWLAGDVKAAMTSSVRGFSTLEDAADWLLLNTAELARVRTGDGFADIARFTAAAPAR